jgi:hypothetical protein
MLLLFLAALFAADMTAQLPDGAGREETERLCKNCHDLARSVSKRQDRDGWHGTLTKMAALGTRMTDKEFLLVLDYLAKHFPADEDLKKVPNVDAGKIEAKKDRIVF